MVIDVHTHFLPRFFVDEARAGGVFGVTASDDSIVHPDGFRYPISPEFIDVDAKLRHMDLERIDVSVLSLAPTLFFYDAEADEAATFTRRSNDALATMVSQSDRLAGLASLPLQDVDAAAAELERSVRDLGLLGAHIGTTCGDKPLDAPELAAVLAAAERLDVPLMLHPYSVGPNPALANFYLANSLGFPFQTTIAAVRLIHSGALDRHPRLRIGLMHAGGFLPYQLGRIDHAFDVRQEPKVAIEQRPSAYLDRFWIDTITHRDAALGFLRDLVKPERLYLGTDLPFDMADPEPVARIERLGIDATESAATALLNSSF